MISIMANNYFDTIVQEPLSPEREIREISSPPKLRRGDYTLSLTDNKEILLRKYLSAKIEIEKLKTEIELISEKINYYESIMQNGLNEIKLNEKKLNKVQEILFENSEKIPEGIYIQLMDALVKT
jgi:hypothetical protein